MTAGVEFNDEVQKKLKNHGKTYSMYNHDNISKMKGIPLQQDSFACGIYTIWYLLMECYEGEKVVDCNPEMFCEQLLFYIICLYIYCHCVEKKSYNFPKTFEWSDFMKKAFKKGSDIHEIITDFMESQQDFQVTQLSSLSFQTMVCWIS